MRRVFNCLFLSFLLAGNVFAQVDEKYLSGAVPEEEGKVVFKETFRVDGASRAEVYRKAISWAEKHFTDEERKLMYTDAEKAVFSCRGNEELVFKASALSLDKTVMRYQLNLFCEDGSCKVEIKSISYIYNVSYKNEPEVYKAEDWITDKEAVNKKKLYRNNGKFRIKTIDFIEDTFSSLNLALGAKAEGNTAQRESRTVVSAPVYVSSADIASSTHPLVKSHKKIDADRIPLNVIKQLSNDWMLITAGDDTKFNMMTASWGGLGVLWEKPVAFCFINPSRYTFQLMDSGEYYTLSFYTEAYREALQYCGRVSGKDTDKVKGSQLTPISMPSGSKAFEEAWLILECKKVLGQQLSPDAIIDSKVKEEWGSKQLHKMFGGEIIGVWVK